MFTMFHFSHLSNHKQFTRTEIAEVHRINGGDYRRLHSQESSMYITKETEIGFILVHLQKKELGFFIQTQQSSSSMSQYL
ncbi:hypothetical protein LINPERHAP1_LOCUS20102 [Linum perenne]